MLSSSNVRRYATQGPAITVAMATQAILPHILKLVAAMVWRCQRCMRPLGGSKNTIELAQYHRRPEFDIVPRAAYILNVSFFRVGGCGLLAGRNHKPLV